MSVQYMIQPFTTLLDTTRISIFFIAMYFSRVQPKHLEDIDMVHADKKQLTALGLAMLLGFSLITSGCATKSTASDEALSRAEAASARAEAAAQRAETAAQRAETAAEKAERIFEQKMKK